MQPELPSFGQALATVFSHAGVLSERRPRVERIPLEECTGRVLAGPVHADRDMPSFARSTRDGFACRAAEASAHGWLAVTGSIRAGDPPAPPLTPGAAFEIMTGAAVPEGADAVAMLEHVEHAEVKIRLAAGRNLDAGENVVAAGAEARAGHELISPGVRLGPAHIAAAACCGYATMEVFAKPRVAILTTGDELLPVASNPAPGQIRNSNAPMLASLVARQGTEAWVLPAVRDEGAAVEAALRRAMDADLLLISGGVSAGKFDLVEPALARIGASFFFTGVRIQPGKPLVFGEIARAGGALPLFGLPGNPISSAATFLLFAAPILAALAGSHEPSPRFDLARLARDVKGKPGLTRFVPATTTFAFGLPEVAPVGSQGSGDLAAFARADCFVEVPEGTERLFAGETAHILRF
ncbi:MAG TPA: gephyrin-like molybdotransferase Glp [Terracidiphilus sp.]|jgi:molybdopterin molybdotransferase|nr:gephyrin-like molybdotransferase Glp [Terracidiphilus sp.]